MSYATVSKTLSTFTQNLIKVIQDGCNLATHEHTDEDIANWEHQVKTVTGYGTKDISDEASAKARENVTSHLMSGGMSKMDAEKLFEQHLKKVVDIAEKARTTGLFTWQQFVGVATAIFVGATTLVYVNDKSERDRQKAMLDLVDRTKIEQEQLQQLSIIVLSNDEFNILTGSLFVPLAPAPEVILPAQIVAVAAQPAIVVQTDSSGQLTHEITTTVGNVYRNLPREAQRQMESSPPPAFHVDHSEDMNDCFHTDCLKGIDKQFHKGISITNGDGSATISVSVPR